MAKKKKKATLQWRSDTLNECLHDFDFRVQFRFIALVVFIMRYKDYPLLKFGSWIFPKGLRVKGLVFSLVLAWGGINLRRLGLRKFSYFIVAGGDCGTPFLPPSLFLLGHKVSIIPQCSPAIMYYLSQGIEGSQRVVNQALKLCELTTSCFSL